MPGPPSILGNLSETVHSQVGGTCYANAVATAIRAVEGRIIGRNPEPHADLVESIVRKYGTDGAVTKQVLEDECGKRSLAFQELDSVIACREVLEKGRTVIVTFHLNEDEWHAFSEFYKSNPFGVLKERDMKKFSCDDSLPQVYDGHAVILKCVSSSRDHDGTEYLEIKNSWGGKWADKGTCRIAYEFFGNREHRCAFYDVFYRQCDLTPQDWENFRKAERMNQIPKNKDTGMLKSNEVSLPVVPEVDNAYDSDDDDPTANHSETDYDSNDDFIDEVLLELLIPGAGLE